MLTAFPDSTKILPLSSLMSSDGILPIISSLLLSHSFKTFLYGVSIKPNSLILPKVEREPNKPIFGPSGVSIGQILP